jgi:hypothetical protein
MAKGRMMDTFIEMVKGELSWAEQKHPFLLKKGRK